MKHYKPSQHSTRRALVAVVAGLAAFVALPAVADDDNGSDRVTRVTGGEDRSTFRSADHDRSDQP